MTKHDQNEMTVPMLEGGHVAILGATGGGKSYTARARRKAEAEAWEATRAAREAADLAATLDEQRRQVDALLGPEVAP